MTSKVAINQMETAGAMCKIKIYSKSITFIQVHSS